MLRSKSNFLKRKLKIDSKGRICLPAEIRKNFNLNEDSEVVLVFDLSQNIIFLVFGQDGVMASTKACGAFSSGSNPDPDLENKKCDKNE